MEVKVSSDADRLMSYRFMRQLVGVIAILIAPVVVWLSGEGSLPSISASYWTGARDVFVGLLVAVGFFLSAYNGSGRRWSMEYLSSKAACIFVLLVALFPTQGGEPAPWVSAVCRALGVSSMQVHYVAAALFFACLFIILFEFSGRASEKGVPFRAWLYRSVAVLMVAGMAVLWWLLGEQPGKVFWVELWGLTAFGLGWISAGTYHLIGPSQEAMATVS